MKLAGSTTAALIAAVIALGSSGCGGRAFPAPDVVARVADQELAYADFESYLRTNSMASEVALSSEVLSGLFDQYIDEALLARLGRERYGLDAAVSAQAAVRTLIDQAPEVDVSEAQVAAYFADHSSEFERQETVLLGQILVETREAAEEARRALAGGMNFEEAARRFSQGPGAELGGVQGELSRADLPPDFAEVIFGLGEGQTSEIVPADYGFHIFRVIERRPPMVPSAGQVHEEILERLRQEGRKRALVRLVEEARTSYNVAVYARNLPFNYDGIHQ